MAENRSEDWKLTIKMLAWVAIPLALFFGGALSIGKIEGWSNVSKAKTAAAQQLRDPSSAQFRNIRVNGSAVCGEINGKNGYGAYAGFKKFYFYGGSASIDPEEEPIQLPGFATPYDPFNSSYRLWCE